MSDELAIFGGPPILAEPLPRYRSLSEEEIAAVERVVRSDVLSGFYGSWGDQFLGGPMVRALEEAWQQRFSVRHAVSMNSATSGLYAAMGALGIGPGDEVIVPPFTMSATAIAPLIYGGIPVFADIDPDTFCIDPAAVRARIGPRTKAIIAVNLFGQPAPLAELLSLARRHGIALVEDNAQSPLAREGDRYAGTVGDIGVFSLNYHKHFHSGEGGVCVTNDDRLAMRLRLIRNHAESVVEEAEVQDITDLVGFNFRMTELSAVVARGQLERADEHVARRQRLAAILSEEAHGLEGITPPKGRAGCEHVFYLWAFRIDEGLLGVDRDLFSTALEAEGFPHFRGYLRPLYLLPLFQRRIAIGREGFPFTLSNVRYAKGDCPVAERMWERELLCFEACMYDVDDIHAHLLGQAIRKVHAQRAKLRAGRERLRAPARG